MTEGPQRHVRLRLARRRTAPARVRVRVREEGPAPGADPTPEPEPAPEPDAEPAPDGRPAPAADPSRARRVINRVRRARWSHFITVGATALAAVAAIGGLWAQAVTTFWSQQTAKDQLRQSQEDQEKEERVQAMAVSLWVDRADDTDDTSWRLHILNRSPDPVPFMQAAYLIRVGGGGSARALAVSGPANAYLVVNTTRLAPCTELVFSSKQAGRDWGSPKGEESLPPPGSRLHSAQSRSLTSWTAMDVRGCAGGRASSLRSTLRSGVASLLRPKRSSGRSRQKAIH